MRRAVRVLLGLVTLAAVLLVFVFPVRTLIDQRDQMAVAEHRIKGLSAENQRLAQQVALLQTNSYIEQEARDKYGLAMPGDHVYEILP